MNGLNNEVLAIIPRLPLKVQSYEPINWKRVQTTPIFIINAEEGKYVLKLFASPQGLVRQTLHRLFGNLGLKNQIIINKFLKKQVFFQFCTPILVASDGSSYLLFQFINIAHKGEYEINEDLVIDSLIEFYSIPGQKIAMNLTNYLINITRKPLFLIMRRVVGNLRRIYGISLAFAVIKVLFECYVDQKPFSSKILLHNDFHHNNVFLDFDGRFYISDFENSVFESRWMLVDIVHYSVGTQKFNLNTNVIKKFFLRYVENNPNFKIDFRAQLLMAYLLRISQMVLSTVPPKSVQKRYFKFFYNVLLNGKNFEKWVSKRFFDC